MKRIFKIVKREYISRVKKKSFIILTLLAPFLIALFYGGIGYVTYLSAKPKEKKAFVLNNQQIAESLIADSSKRYTFYYKKGINKSDIFNKTFKEDGLFVFNKDSQNIVVSASIILKKDLSISAAERLKKKINNAIVKRRMNEYGLSRSTLDSLENNIAITINTASEKDIKTSKTEASTGISYVLAFLIYMFIFIYGVQVMKSVSMEKSNRIVELIVSTVKPFELMMGKILGILFVGLTQIGVWIILGGASFTAIGYLLKSKMQNMSAGKQANMNDVMGAATEQLSQFNFVYIAFVFVLFFIGGYLLYASMFAAIGAAVDNETETSQFTFPVSMPLILAFVVGQSLIMTNPNNSLSEWMSMIPFFSPIIMTLRVPFNPPMWQVFTSVLILFSTSFIITKFAAKIYRVGLLMYGKKASWKEMMKWIFYK